MSSVSRRVSARVRNRLIAAAAVTAAGAAAAVARSRRPQLPAPAPAPPRIGQSREPGEGELPQPGARA